jgi:hypothetical protein
MSDKVSLRLLRMRVGASDGRGKQEFWFDFGIKGLSLDDNELVVSSFWRAPSNNLDAALSKARALLADRAEELAREARRQANEGTPTGSGG